MAAEQVAWSVSASAGNLSPRARNQLVELRGAVEQAVLGMDVQ